MAERDRYRKAAEEALQQLDWCIDYLHRIHKTRSRPSPQWCLHQAQPNWVRPGDRGEDLRSKMADKT